MIDFNVRNPASFHDLSSLFNSDYDDDDDDDDDEDDDDDDEEEDDFVFVFSRYFE